MKVTIHSTDKIVILKPDVLSEGVPARVWEGETESGIKVHCYITRIAIDKNETRTDEFTSELLECQEPSVEISKIPNRLIL